MAGPAKPTIFIVHQNIPAQFRNLAPALVAEGYNVYFITAGPLEIADVTKVSYEVDSPTLLLDPVQSMFTYARKVGRAGAYLRTQHGVEPDLIIGHVNWGELMFLRDLYPKVPIIGYFEWFHSERFADFDPLYEVNPDAPFVYRTKNIPNYVTADICTAGISPTWWQQSSYPISIQSKISVIHDGTDTVRIQRPEKAIVRLPNGIILSSDDEVVTYVSRGLEPVRGFPTAIRAIAELCRIRPKAHFIVVGRDQAAYGNPLPAGDSYRARLMAELGDKLDLNRVHFVGNVPYDTFLGALYVSSAHIYLTYPFILSWSMLEAMAAGCLLFGSRTPPVEEVIVDGYNGLLVDFHDHNALAIKVADSLARRDHYQPLRKQARRTILERYDLHSICLPRQKALVRSLL